MKYFANENKKPFGELTDREQACLARASADGKLQWLHGDNWVPTSGIYGLNIVYRTKPNSLEGQIPWDLIDDKFVAFAIDKDKSAWFFTSIPSIDFEDLNWNSSDYVYYESILKLDLEEINWADSLVIRPGHE